MARRHNRYIKQRLAIAFIDETIIWQSVTIHVRHERGYLEIDGWSRLEIKVVSPSGHPLPISDQGSVDLELDEAEVHTAGGAAALVMAWLEREKGCRRYSLALRAYKQLTLF